MITLAIIDVLKMLSRLARGAEILIMIALAWL
jgi:hypothetical protein